MPLTAAKGLVFLGFSFWLLLSSQDVAASCVELVARTPCMLVHLHFFLWPPSRKWQSGHPTFDFLQSLAWCPVPLQLKQFPLFVLSWIHEYFDFLWVRCAYQLCRCSHCCGICPHLDLEVCYLIVLLGDDVLAPCHIIPCFDYHLHLFLKIRAAAASLSPHCCVLSWKMSMGVAFITPDIVIYIKKKN